MNDKNMGGIIGNIILLAVANLIGQSMIPWGDGTMNGIAWILILGQALIIKAIKDLKH